MFKDQIIDNDDNQVVVEILCPYICIQIVFVRIMKSYFIDEMICFGCVVQCDCRFVDRDGTKPVHTRCAG